MNELENRSLAGVVIYLAGRGKWWLLPSVVGGGLLLLAVSYLMPILYRSEAILMIAPSDAGQQLEVSGGISALASLGGIQLGGQSRKDDVVLEIAKSRSFITEFISRRSISLTNDDASLSLLKRYRLFVKRFSISKDKFSGLISIAYVDQEGAEAKRVLDAFISDLNTYMRERDVDSAKRSLDYLAAEISKSNQEAVRKMLYGLMENNYRKIALANSTEQYALTVLDAPYVPEAKYSPERLLLSIAGAVMGMFMGLSILYYKNIQ